MITKSQKIKFFRLIKINHCLVSRFCFENRCCPCVRREFTFLNALTSFPSSLQPFPFSYILGLNGLGSERDFHLYSYTTFLNICSAYNLGLFVVQKNKKTMIKEKGKEICQRVLDTNFPKKIFAIIGNLCYDNTR